MFANVKDKGAMNDFFDAAKDEALCVYMEAAYTIVFRPMEECRRWGMTCCCEHHVKMRAEDHVHHIPCFWNGKTLHLVSKHFEIEKEAAIGMGQTVTDDDCEGSFEIKQLITVMLAKKLDGLDKFFGYFSSLPWAFSCADTIEGAQECMRLLRAKPFDKQDPVTRDIANSLGGDIERRSRGEPVSTALAMLVKKLKHITIVEDLGEGYHRDTNVEKRRAAAATARYLKQQTRFKMTIQHMRDFIAKHGDLGKQVFRFEFRRYKRLLQTKKRYKWRPMKMSTPEFYARVYREDDMAAEDFTSICRRESPVDPVEKDAFTGRDALRDEYLVSVLEKGKQYSVTQQIKRAGPDGTPVVEEKAVHFTLLETSHGSHRPKMLATSEQGDNVAMAAHLALQVLLAEPWVPSPAPAPVPGSTRRYLLREAKAVWIRPQDIGPHEAWYAACQTWTLMPSDMPKTIMVHDPHRVANKIPYLDPRCPTLPITWALKRAGWKGIERSIVHTENEVAEFDSYACTRAKPYFQVLYQLPQSLALTSSIPSRQPMTFYRLMLQNVKVEPRLGNAVYARMWKELLNKGLVPLFWNRSRMMTWIPWRMPSPTMAHYIRKRASAEETKTDGPLRTSHARPRRWSWKWGCAPACGRSACRSSIAPAAGSSASARPTRVSDCGAGAAGYR